jgi:hypothetical protein
VPESQVADNDAALFDDGLQGRRDLLALAQEILPDTTTGSVTVGAFLRIKPKVVVGSKPDFGRPILWSGCDKGHVDDKGKWVVRVGKVGV